MADKNLMKEIGDVMEKLLYKKKKPVPAVEPPEQFPEQVEPEERQTSPWTRATDLDAKMKKRMKDAGL